MKDIVVLIAMIVVIAVLIIHTNNKNVSVS